MVVARSLTVLALFPLAALAQKPVPVRLDIPSVKKAVVTIHALDASGEAVASGTGFFVTGGSVVTAAHVLQGAAACSVELSDGQTMRCSVAASDTAKDVVMLLVGGQPPATLRFGTSDDAKDGDEITVVSNPLGELPGTVSKGIVSASRVVGGTKLIQISAAISHGSSGAPVLDSHGQVIGIVRSTITEGQSLNFATATDAVRYMLNSPSAVAEAQGFFAARPAAPAAAAPRVAPVTGGPGRRTIQVGQTVNSTLSSSDEIYSDSTYYQRWSFTTQPNTAITIDLASDDFDPVLLLTGLDSTVVDVRHRGPGCAARIALVFPGAGPYSVMANTSVTPVRQTGRYVLSLTQGLKPLLPDDPCTPAGSSAPAASANGNSMHQIQVGQSVNGTLTTADNLYRDTTYYQYWQFTTTAGTPLTVDLSSDDFDPYLIVRGFHAADGRDSSSVDDDGGPGCAARVATIFPTTGTYTILVNTTSTQKNRTGNFTLSITRGLKPLITGDCSSSGATAGGGGRAQTEGTITVGQSVQGQLTSSDYLRPADTTYAQWWLLQGHAGQQVTIDLEADSFDAYVFLYGPGLTDGVQDDDGGGNCNARLTVMLPQDGEYRILVNTRGKYETGPYTLSVTAGSKPKSLQRCSRR
ncbi:MAG TPA: trypsin-like peptidase domain-containing protein [Gemmatimonadales bacterium]